MRPVCEAPVPTFMEAPTGIEPVYAVLQTAA